MRAVYLIGIGQTAVSKNGGVRGRYLVADAIEQAIYHAGIDPADLGMLVVGNMMSGLLAQHAPLGASFVSLNAKRMALYMGTYGVEAKDFAHFAITAHHNALSNPNALLHKPLDMDTYLNSRVLVDPVKLFDAPPICDGAAAIILAS